MKIFIFNTDDGGLTAAIWHRGHFSAAGRAGRKLLPAQPANKWAKTHAFTKWQFKTNGVHPGVSSNKHSRQGKPQQ